MVLLDRLRPLWRRVEARAHVPAPVLRRRGGRGPTAGDPYSLDCQLGTRARVPAWRRAGSSGRAGAPPRRARHPGAAAYVWCADESRARLGHATRGLRHTRQILSSRATRALFVSRAPSATLHVCRSGAVGTRILKLAPPFDKSTVTDVYVQGGSLSVHGDWPYLSMHWRLSNTRYYDQPASSSSYQCP